MLIVEESKRNQIEAKLDARSHHKIIEAHTRNFPGAMEVRGHLGDVVRRGADVGEGKNDHEAPQADLLTGQPRSHHPDDQDQCGRLPDDEDGEDDELDADEVVGEYHEAGGVKILIRLHICLAIIRKEVKPDIVDGEVGQPVDQDRKEPNDHNQLGPLPPLREHLLIRNRVHLVIRVEVKPDDVLQVKDARLISYAHEYLRVNGRCIRRVLIFILLCDQGEAEHPAHGARHGEDVDERQVLAHGLDLDEAVDVAGADNDEEAVEGDDGARDAPDRHAVSFELLAAAAIGRRIVPKRHLPIII